MKAPEIQITRDGSPTLFLADLNEHYHSIHGAMQESLHVFIKEGLSHFTEGAVSILEVGLGTALNAVLSFDYAASNGLQLHYTALEAYPLAKEIWQQLSFGKKYDVLFNHIHEAAWNTELSLAAGTLIKHHMQVQDFQAARTFDLIYYDAFAPSKQAEMWTEERMRRMHGMLKTKGLLVTYCANGQFKRNLKAAGFEVQCPPGPAGKREMTVGIRRVDR